MHVLIVAGFIVVKALQDATGGNLPAWVIVPSLGAYLLGTFALTRMNTALFLKSNDPGGPGSPAALKRHGILSLATRVWLVGGLGGLMLLGYGQWANEGLHLASVPLAGEIIALAPFVAGVLLMWIADYPYHCAIWRAIHARTASPGATQDPAIWTLAEYLGYNTRHHLLFIAVPVALVILIADSLTLIMPRFLTEQEMTYALPGAMIIVVALVFSFAPLLIVRIWRTERLGDGEMRSALERICQGLGLKSRDILVWRSGGMITNAAVLGLFAQSRYILLSDGLIEQMDRRDIEAIFAHEAAHIIHHHILYAVLFTIAVVNTSVLAGYWVASLWGDWAQWAGNLIVLGVVGGVWGLGFGWVSRRFERQSDATAAWMSGNPPSDEDPDLITHEGAAAFARALQRVGDLNGIPARRRNWRHGSLAQRISYVLWLGESHRTRRRDDTIVKRIKAAIWIMLAAAAVFIAVTLFVAP